METNGNELKGMNMEITTMGRVTVAARISNFQDAYQVEKGLLQKEKQRSIEVSDALVDTGAMLLSLPSRLIRELDLTRQRTRTARTAAGVVSIDIYEPVVLTVQNRDCVVEVAELPDDCPVLDRPGAAGAARFRRRSGRVGD